MFLKTLVSLSNLTSNSLHAIKKHAACSSSSTRPRSNRPSINLVLRNLTLSSTKCQDHIDRVPLQDEESSWHTSSTGSTQPVVLSRDLKFLPPYIQPKQAWLESLSTVEDNKIGLIDLHPDIFGAFPRIDLIHKNVEWQFKYRTIDYRCFKTRAEARGGGRKPKPQKKAGVRIGSLRSPQFPKGGSAFGPRGPTTNFYMLSDMLRTHGLCSALSIKLAQNDLFFVDSLEIPSDELEYLEDLVDVRFWGFSVLFVDDTDIMPKNITLAVEDKPSFNLMPLYGLNVYSMLKHEKLVLTLAAVEKLEEKLLHQLHQTERQTSFQIHG